MSHAGLTPAVWNKHLFCSTVFKGLSNYNSLYTKYLVCDLVFNPFRAETFFRRQILTFKDDPRTERINNIKLIMVVDPYSNEALRDINSDIYDDFKLEKPFGLHGLKSYFGA